MLPTPRRMLPSSGVSSWMQLYVRRSVEPITPTALVHPIDKVRRYDRNAITSPLTQWPFDNPKRERRNGGRLKLERTTRFLHRLEPGGPDGAASGNLMAGMGVEFLAFETTLERVKAMVAELETEG